MVKAERAKLLPNPKQIRFAALVTTCGKPETITLWTKPEKNLPFMKAVRDNRVLTLVLKPSGNHPDFGEIAFHQRPNALYLVFPKPLPKSPDAKVVGIKYDLFEDRPAREPTAKASPTKQNKRLKLSPSAASTASKTIPKEKPKPIPPKRFEVTILRTASVELKITVQGLNIHDAEASALQAVDKKKFTPEKIQNEIKAIAEI